MSVSFRSVRTFTTLHNPMKDYALDRIPLEIRFDPLTGRTSRVFDLPYTAPPRPDLEKMAARSRESFCPFCPENVEKSTPGLPADLLPEGRLRAGGAVVVPNLLPLDKYARICPRLLTRAVGNSDCTYLQALHREPYCVVTPESVSDRIRKFFQGDCS